MKRLPSFLLVLVSLSSLLEGASDLEPHQNTPLTISIHVGDFPNLGSSPLTMDLLEVLERADTQNLSLRASQNATQVADAGLDAATYRWWPSISVGVLRSHTDGTLQGTFGDIGTSSFGTAIANAIVRWDLNPGQTHFQVQRAEREAAATHAGAEAARQETHLLAARLYLELVGTAALATVARQTQDDAEEFLNITVTLEENGLGPDVDVQRARTQLARRRQVLAAAYAAFRIASARLAEALNLKPDTTIVPRQEEIRAPGLPAPESQDSLIAQAILNRPETREAAENIAAAEAALSGFRWAAYGLDVAVGLQEGAVGQTFNDTGERTIYGAQIEWTFRPSQIGELRAVSARLEAFRIEEEKTRQRICREVVAAREGIELARQNLDYTGEALEAAERALKLSQLRFSGGLGSSLEFLDAQEALATVRINAVTVLVDAHRAVFELQRALGAASTPITSESSPLK